MNAIKEIIEKASRLNGSIVLPEGQDARVITAACALVDRKICRPVVLGTPEEIAAAEAKAGLSLAERSIEVIDFTKGDSELESAFLESWNAKEAKKPEEKRRILDQESARKAALDQPEIAALIEGKEIAGKRSSAAGSADADSCGVDIVS